MSTTDTFGKRLRKARLKRRLSLSALAELLAAKTGNKTTKSLVSQWENGRVKNPQNPTVVAIENVLRVNREWLVNGNGKMELASITSNSIAKPTFQISSSNNRQGSKHDESYQVPIENAVSSLGLGPEVAKAAIRAVARVLMKALKDSQHL